MFNPLEHLTAVLSSKKFLSKQGLGNELPFFIFPYNPKDELEIKVMLPRLSKKLNELDINTLQVDLYVR